MPGYGPTLTAEKRRERHDIDDATGRLMHLRFAETESAFDYHDRDPGVS